MKLSSPSPFNAGEVITRLVLWGGGLALAAWAAFETVAMFQTASDSMTRALGG